VAEADYAGERATAVDLGQSYLNGYSWSRNCATTVARAGDHLGMPSGTPERRRHEHELANRAWMLDRTGGRYAVGIGWVDRMRSRGSYRALTRPSRSQVAGEWKSDTLEERSAKLG
jgi:hypothetical protein